ncbi:MAG: biopolymer transporter ExbD [Gammaproteobacteria bacterium]|nr:biopolymer transporter ExbD [Gammaproteobacteria bacterium]
MKRESRRMRRMGRSRKKTPGMNLTSLMDVFTILVFFLLTNSASNEALEPPKIITLPASVVETKPKETVVVLISTESIMVQGEVVAATSDVIASNAGAMGAIKQELLRQKNKAIGLTDDGEPAIPEINLLADKEVPFSLLKTVMSTCTSAGYVKISLAVIQKASQG